LFTEAWLGRVRASFSTKLLLRVMLIDFVVWPLTRALLPSSHPTWLMERQIEQVHKSNLNQFDYILSVFAESP
jgi:hypothetical protein